MAVYEYTLKAITDRRKAPYYQYSKTIAGTDELKIYAGSLFDVPNVWEIAAARLVLTTDATVANRFLQLRQVTSISTLFDAKGDAVAASSAVTHLFVPISTESATITAAWCGIARDFCLIQGDGEYVYVTVDTGKPGDTVTCRLLFRWKNWELGMLPPYVLTAQEKMIQAQEYPRYY